MDGYEGVLVSVLSNVMDAKRYHKFNKYVEASDAMKAAMTGMDSIPKSLRTGVEYDFTKERLTHAREYIDV